MAKTRTRILVYYYGEFAGMLEFGSEVHPPIRSSSRGLPSVDIKHGPFVTTSQILHAKPSTELVEEQPMSPPAFREPKLVGTPSPTTMDEFKFGDRDSKASFRSRSTVLSSDRCVQ